MKLTFFLSTLPSLAFASSPPIAGFTPRTSVTDHNAIDLDQALIEEFVASEATFPDAKAIYEQGAHSKSVARITFDSGVSLPQDLPKGTKVTGVSVDGNTVVGFLYKAYEAGANVIEIQYEVIDIQESYVNCQVGGRGESGNLDGCFQESGSVTIDNIGTPFTYTYVPHLDNNNGRTIQGFSTGADSKMRVNGDGDYYVDFQKFFNYYGRFDYADNFIQAAFSGGRTDFTNGNNDFTGFGIDGKSEGVKKGSNYMAIAMYVIRELEDAIDDCNRGCSTDACNDDAVHALDEAVAFYTGSLEGPAKGGTGEGVLIHRLANKRGPQFNTANAEGNSFVNEQVFLEFERMKNALVGSSTPDCAAARQNKERIAELMFVPMIQGAIRYAYILGTGPDDDNEKAKAEGAVFSASVLPLVHACDVGAASTIYNNMHMNAPRPDFGAVKSAFESTYACMGITCEDVGGYWNAAEQSYWAGAEPCGTTTELKSSKSGNGLSTGAIVGIVIGCVAVVGIVAYFVCGKKKSEVEFKSDSAPEQSAV